MEEVWLTPALLSAGSLLAELSSPALSACPLCKGRPGKCQARFQSGQLDQLGSHRQANRGSDSSANPTLRYARRCFCLDKARWMIKEDGVWMQNASREPTAQRRLVRLMHV